MDSSFTLAHNRLSLTAVVVTSHMKLLNVRQNKGLSIMGTHHSQHHLSSSRHRHPPETNTRHQTTTTTAASTTTQLTLTRSMGTELTLFGAAFLLGVPSSSILSPLGARLGAASSCRVTPVCDSNTHKQHALHLPLTQPHHSRHAPPQRHMSSAAPHRHARHQASCSRCSRTTAQCARWQPPWRPPRPRRQ